MTNKCKVEESSLTGQFGRPGSLLEQDGVAARSLQLFHLSRTYERRASSSGTCTLVGHKRGTVQARDDDGHKRLEGAQPGRFRRLETSCWGRQPSTPPARGWSHAPRRVSHSALHPLCAGKPRRMADLGRNRWKEAEGVVEALDAPEAHGLRAAHA
jgi:hypothetical protein